MKSKLFEKFAKLPGINIFNWREKIERTESQETPRIEPIEEAPPRALYKQAKKWFGRVIAQDNYIKALQHLLDSYEHEVSKWDLIQKAHEDEMQKVRDEMNAKMSRSLMYEKNQEIASLRQELANLKNHPKTLFTDQKADKFMHHLEMILKAMDKAKTGYTDGQLRQLVESLQSVINKQKAHQEGLQ